MCQTTDMRSATGYGLGSPPRSEIGGLLAGIFSTETEWISIDDFANAAYPDTTFSITQLKSIR